MKFIKLDERATLPVRATLNSAGYDFKALVGGTVLPGRRLLVPTGIGLDPNIDGQYTYLQLLGKSGLAYKRGLIVMAGVIDSDYAGDIGVMLYNTDFRAFTFLAGDAVAQGVIIDISRAIDEEAPLQERMGGFGSTGK